jgi:hypothetical protein
MNNANLKKTIAAVALTAASSSAFAIRGPRPLERQEKTYCLDASMDSNGLVSAATCDMTANNQKYHTKILAHGCADEQINLTVSRSRVNSHSKWSNWTVEIASCRDPRLTQL